MKKIKRALIPFRFECVCGGVISRTLGVDQHFEHVDGAPCSAPAPKMAGQMYVRIPETKAA